MTFDPIATEALRCMEETNQHIFLTGKAGTGKSTLLEHFRATTKKNVAVVAPTGVAALNVRGQTIHSFCAFTPQITVSTVQPYRGKRRKMFEELQTLIIDEISMVRADLLDCVDTFLRLTRGNALPFGGVQIIFIGDLYQLPPVVNGDEEKLFSTYYKSGYFFASQVFQNIEGEIKYIELQKAYRQTDMEFLEMLDAIRIAEATDNHIAALNKRHNPAFKENESDLYIYLKTTNAAAEAWNRMKLEKLKTQLHTFKGTIMGDFKERNLPTSEELTLKEGAQVMLLSNDSAKRWVNGDIGKISRIDTSHEGGPIISVVLLNGMEVPVMRHTWDMVQFYYNEDAGRIDSQVVASFTQLPMKLAWAVTIHKSQGKTFDRVVIDFGRGTFAEGQAYVALSRCRTLEGIVLTVPLQQRHIFVSDTVKEFMARFEKD